MRAALSSLSIVDRDALALLALAPRPISRSAWQDQIRKVNLRTADGSAIHGAGMQQLADRLVAAGWILYLDGSRTGYVVVDGALAEIFDELASRERVASLTAPLMPKNSAWGFGELDTYLRLAFVTRERSLIEGVALRTAWLEPGDLLRAMTQHPPTRWLSAMPSPVRALYVGAALAVAFQEPSRLGEGLIADILRHDVDDHHARAALLLALSDDVVRAREIVTALPGSQWTLGVLAIASLVEGNWAEARNQFERARAWREPKKQVKRLPPEILYFDLLLATSPVARASDAAGLGPRIESASTALQALPYVQEAFRALAAFRVTGRARSYAPMPSPLWQAALVHALTLKWTGVEKRGYTPTNELHRDRAKGAGYGWIARQFEGALSPAASDPTLFASLTSTVAPWETALSALSTAFEPDATPAKTESQGELYWTVTLDANLGADYPVELTPRLAKRTGQQGQVLSVQRLVSDESLPVRAEDRPLIEVLVAAKKQYQGNSTTFRGLRMAIGHPRLRAESGAPVSVVAGVSELRLNVAPGGTRLEIYPWFPGELSVVAIDEGATITVYERTESLSKLLSVLGTGSLFVPTSGLSQVTEVIARIAPHVPVRGVELLGESAGAKTEPADGRLRVQLFASGSAFRVRLRVKPGGDEGPSLRPGLEPKHVLVTHEGETRSYVRDLPEELLLVEKLLAKSGYLASLGMDGEDRLAADIETCLGLLTELGPLSGGDILIEWPEGQKLRLPITRDEKALRVRVGGDQQWLAVSSDMAVDEGRVLSLSFLLDSLSRAHGRFVPIGEGEYLALAGSLREKLDALARVQALSDKKGRASLAILPAVASWTEGADVTYGDGMDQRLIELAKASDVVHRVPRALEAELRDYQRDGFVFLARRTSSGFGACLADDMGLGKTVQALALILSRAAKGPSLVVAPTSVCRNWEAEAQRFAPTLSFVRFGEADDREACVKALGPRDVLLCSYGLLAPAEEILSKVRFATAVFDEAHALKNAETRRASAARGIAADAIVALSGTPLENHLGELHSLFDLIAPGLLGNRERFERAFIAPIARGDKRAMAHLRTLVRPFILRRTKSQVLEELPEKTEMTRTITQSPAERDFYEAVRRTALARIEKAAKERGAQARIEVLAEITKLRRAAIDPRLVAGDKAPEGSKLEALADLVLELRDEGHRALVFSQFLEVLDRTGANFRAKGISYVRLDGSMNAQARAVAVEAFQSGQADVFLLSLKAGGVGMNLTAADYVIHVDPWWNPAVEDQATDRAHRIGQTRPVTVVRLVTEGTIEEKVLALHASKRALYEDALSDMDVAKQLDVHALLDLLKDDSVQPLERGGRKPKRRGETPDEPIITPVE